MTGDALVEKLRELKRKELMGGMAFSPADLHEEADAVLVE